MRLHRFYIGSGTELKHDFWLHDEALIHQWLKVLRFQSGQEVVLFDGQSHDRLYKIVELKDNEAHLEHVTDFERKLPKKTIYLFWALLKKDKNDWVLQKCTELGISHFIPILADRSEKTGFNIERAEKIVIEAAEQCGRSDIPSVREPMQVSIVIDEFKDKINLYTCDEEGPNNLEETEGETGVFIGPEGGWSDQEKALFASNKVKHLNLHDFTLRAETAAVTIAGKLLQ